MLLAVAAIPAGVTAAIVVIAWFAIRNARDGGVPALPAITAISVASGVTAASWFVLGAPPAWPADAVGFSIHAVWAGALFAWQPRRLPRLARVVATAIVGVALGYLVLRGRIAHHWAGVRGLGAVLAAGAAFVLVSVSLQRPARTDGAHTSRGEVVELVELVVLAAGTSAACGLSGTLKIALVMGMLASSLGALAGIAWLRADIVSAQGAMSTAALGIVTCWSITFAYAAMPPTTLVVLLATPLMIGATRRAGASRSGRRWVVLRLTLVVAALGVAIGVAARSYFSPAEGAGNGEYDYGYE